MNYKVTWQSGCIGGTATVYPGLQDRPLKQRLQEAIAKTQNLDSTQVKIMEYKKIKSRSKKSPGLGTPQSDRDY